MIRLFFALLIPFVFYQHDWSGKNQYPSLTDPVDPVEIDLQVLYDKDSLPDGYQARVFTPICEEDKCYAVEIDFYWDLIGRYVRYDTIPGQPLTKLEHEPFTPEEYEKMDQILSNPSSVLANYKKEDLVQDIEQEGVDGVSGATITEIKESVISGAVYSCYVLWHIVNGQITDSLKAITYRNLNEPLVRKLVEKSDQDINYYLINNFSDSDFSSYLSYVLKTLEEGTGYYPKNAIEKMPETALADEEAQLFFAEHFNELNYFTQIALLKKLQPEFITEELSHQLKLQLDERNSQKKQLIIRLTETQNN